jgi:hypothetical protein
MDRLLKLRSRLHEKIKTLRNIEYIIGRPSFENLWILSDEPQQEKLLNFVEQKNKEEVINWYRNHPFLELGDLTTVQLREMGRKYYVLNYSRLSKMELLLALRQAKENPTTHTSISRKALIPEMKKLIQLMLPILTEAGIPEDYLYIHEEAEELDKSLIHESFNWIEQIYNNEYRAAKAIKSLLSDELWERYRSWNDFGDHRETILLTEALQKLRKTVMVAKRPDLFKKTIVRNLVQKMRKEKE